ncbi:MAG: hypothetical protein K2G04_09775, partial [Oscillospiraceae bacterium]|nr:hypothetical protein [Oscillospiraceae bacterium]
AVPIVVLKALVLGATDKKARNIFVVIIAAILVPFITVILIVLSLFGNLENANNSLLDYSFTDTEIPEDFNDEQRTAIENMRQWLSELDAVIAEKEENILDGNTVRAVFYTLRFGAEVPENEEIFDYERFCNCFEGLTAEQLDTALGNVSSKFPQYEITENHRAMIQKVYKYLNEKNI